MEIGAQFFTLREHCKTLDGFAECLKKVAEIGYRTVQISGVCPYEPAWLAEQLKANGLRCVLTHTARERLLNDPKAVARDHDIFDCNHVGLGMFPFNSTSEDGTYDAFLRLYRPVAQTLHENGKYFMYHNHAHEFDRIDGRLILERMAEDMPAEWMGFTLDTYWVQVGGGDPAQWLERLSGRVPCIHLKDYAYGQKMAPVGAGNLNWDRILSTAETAGTRYLLVEQDDCNGEDPFDCLRRSYDFLAARGLH